MGVEKMSVSFDLELGQAIRGSAAASHETVSSWLAQAARDRLRLEALGDAVESWQKVHGELTEAEVSEADRLLGHAAAGHDQGAA